ncbi:MAG: hypothetical protein ACTJF1_06880, partial [Brevibacterium aurantiacum]
HFHFTRGLIRLLASVDQGLVTPAADVLSMVFVAAPMVLLFLTALAITWIHDRKGTDHARSQL